MDRPLHVTFYTRPGCHLCDDAQAELEHLAKQLPLEISAVDITKDQAAHNRWWSDIPVIEIGATILRAPIDPARLRIAVLQGLRSQG